MRKDGKIGAFGMRNREFSYSLTDEQYPQGIVVSAPSWLD
jgi:hypothetical protein